MASGHRLHAFGGHRLKEQAEFNQAVAEDAGIRGQAAAVGGGKGGDDLLAELLAQVNEMQRNAELLGHSLGLAHLLFALRQQEHEKALHGNALLQQQGGGSRGVNPAAEGDADGTGRSGGGHSAFRLAGGKPYCCADFCV